MERKAGQALKQAAQGSVGVTILEGVYKTCSCDINGCDLMVVFAMLG